MYGFFKNDSLSDNASRADINVINPQSVGIFVNVKDFGAKGDGIADDTVAIQNALDSAINGDTVLIPQGNYKTTSSLWIKKDGITLKGYGATIDYLGIKYDSTVPQGSKAVLAVDYTTYNNNRYHKNIVIEGLSLNGHNLTQFVTSLNGFTSGCKVKNVRMVLAIGFMYLNECFYSQFETVTFATNRPTIPGALVDWNYVSNSGLIFLNEGSNSIKFKDIRVLDFGVSSIPVGCETVPSVFHITSGTNLIFEGISLESSLESVDYQTDDITTKDAFRSIFNIGSVRNMKISNVYCELIKGGSLVRFWSTNTSNVAVENFYCMKSTFRYCLIDGSSVNYLRNISVKDLFFQFCTLSSHASPLKAIKYPLLDSSIKLENSIIWGESAYTPSSYISDLVYTVDDYSYTGLNNLGSKGVICGTGDIVSGGHQVPTVISGFETYLGHDSYTPCILVRNGIIRDHRGDIVSFGNTYQSNSIGWILRPDYIENSNWNVCVDVYGGVYLENQALPLTTAQNGKIIIATFELDASAYPTNLIPVTF